MDELIRRQHLNLTQTEAAARAGVSLATWRRFEADANSVSPDTRLACERVLGERRDTEGLTQAAAEISRAWEKSHDLTPRQAFALTLVLDLWANEIADWDPKSESLAEVGPFASFDDRVMFRIGENRAYASATGRRCSAVADMIRTGTLPFHHDGPMIDETLTAAAAKQAEGMYDHWLSEMPELFALIGARTPVEDDELEAYMPGDQDWYQVEDQFDDLSRWEYYDYPLGYGPDHVRSAFVRTSHPFTWFDMPREGDLTVGPGADATDEV